MSKISEKDAKTIARILQMPMVEALEYLSEQWRFTVTVNSEWELETGILYHWEVRDTMRPRNSYTAYFGSEKSYSEALKKGIEKAANLIPYRIG